MSPTPTSSNNPSAEQLIEIPPLEGIYTEPASVSKLWRFSRFFGPAAVIASLSIGAGETIMVTGLGAWSEYGLLWLLLLSVLVKGVFVTYLVGRYTAVTGQPIAQRLVLLPGPRGWLLLAIVVTEVGLISMGLTVVAKPCGNLLTFLSIDALPGGISFAVWENVWTTLFLGGALLFSLFSSYLALEKQQIAICGLLLAGTMAASLIVGPDFGRLIAGAFQFGHLPEAPEWAPAEVREHYYLNLATLFGYVGGSLSGYLAYSSWVGLHGWGLTGHPQLDLIRSRAKNQRRIDYLPDDPVQARRLNVSLTPLRWDVGLGAVVLFVVTAAFMTSGAVVLYPRQQVLPDNSFDLLTKQATVWRQIHGALVPVYHVVVIAALWGTLASVPEAICRVVHSFLGALWPRFAKFPYQRLKLCIVVWFFVTSLAWIWTGVRFHRLTQIGAFATLNLGVAAVCLCIVYFNGTLPKRYRPSRWMLVGGAVSALILLLCAVASGVGLMRKLMAG